MERRTGFVIESLGGIHELQLESRPLRQVRRFVDDDAAVLHVRVERLHALILSRLEAACHFVLRSVEAKTMAGSTHLYPMTLVPRESSGRVLE